MVRTPEIVDNRWERTEAATKAQERTVVINELDVVLPSAMQAAEYLGASRGSIYNHMSKHRDWKVVGHTVDYTDRPITHVVPGAMHTVMMLPSRIRVEGSLGRSVLIASNILEASGADPSKFMWQMINRAANKKADLRIMPHPRGYIYTWRERAATG